MFEKATELDSTFALAYAMLSRMHSRMYLFHFDRSAERLAQAKRSVDRAFQLAPDLPEAHHSLGSYYWLGFADYNRALQELSMAAASKPNDAEIIGTRGTIHQRQGKLREAIADFQLVQQLDPTSPANANGQAQTYMMMHDYARANAQYDRAIALLPDMVPAHFGKTMVALRAEASTQKARAMLDQAAIKGIGDVPYLVWARVWVEVFDRQYDRAIDVLSSKYPDVFEDQNRFVPRTLRYAEVYDFMKRRDLVKAYYDSARVFLLAKVHEHPEDPRLRSALGVALAGLGRKDEAIREGKKGVALLPISVDAFRGYHFEWDLARIYTMVGEYDTAISRLEYLVSIPGWLTPAWLRADPTWDALRSYPRFQRIVAQR
jgi:serine/threonine-protein kinase